MTSDRATRLVIAGAGVAALELVLALRALHVAERLDITMIAPDPDLVVRPDALLRALDGAAARRYTVGPIAYALEVDLIEDRVVAVQNASRTVELAGGAVLPYDELVIATGARSLPTLDDESTVTPGATDPITAVVSGLAARALEHVAVLAGPFSGWTLPAYELAIGLARRAAGRATVTLATHERAPLELFTGDGGTAVAALLTDAGVVMELACRGYRRTPTGVLAYPGGRAIHAGRVLALPALVGPGLEGVPVDERGFICAGPEFGIPGLPGAHVIGDAACYPVKHGGLAAQQAHCVAAGIARRAGVADVPDAPYRGILRATLHVEGHPSEGLFLIGRLRNGTMQRSEVAARRPPWATQKLAAPYLGPFLEHITRDGLVSAVGALPDPASPAVSALHPPLAPAGRLVPVVR